MRQTITASIFRFLRNIPARIMLATRYSLLATALAGTASAAAAVDSIVSTAQADLVLIQAGYDSGLRQGMTLVVTRDGQPVGEILLVELRRQAAAALILNLEKGRTIQPGDTLAIKTIKA